MTNRTFLLDLPHLWVGGRRPTGPDQDTRTPRQLLQEAQLHDSRGQMAQAIRWYDTTIIAAEDDGAAQIIGIVDMYDAMTTTRSYRPAVALEEMSVCHEWWHPDVFDAFMSTFAQDTDNV